MLRTRTLLALAAVATLPSAVAAAYVAQGDPMYERRYFDDAAMTEEVGYEYDGCYPQGAGPGQLQGRRGPYVLETIYARCDQGVLQPA